MAGHPVPFNALFRRADQNGGYVRAIAGNGTCKALCRRDAPDGGYVKASQSRPHD